MRGAELPTKSTGTLSPSEALDPIFVPSAGFANFGGGDSLLLFLTPFSLSLPDPGSDDYLKSNKTKQFLSFKHIPRDKINSEKEDRKGHYRSFKPGGYCKGPNSAGGVSCSATKSNSTHSFIGVFHIFQKALSLAESV